LIEFYSGDAELEGFLTLFTLHNTSKNASYLQNIAGIELVPRSKRMTYSLFLIS